MRFLKSNSGIAISLLLAVLLWGGNNAGTKWLLTWWPPIFAGATRFLFAGLILLALLRWTDWFGRLDKLTPDLRRQLWWRGGFSLGIYVVCFNWALRCTSASHVALYLAASPVWALLWEGYPRKEWRSVQRYAAAFLALAGVFVLFWPALGLARGRMVGEVLGLATSVLWTNYGHQCRVLGAKFNGVEITAHTTWRAAVWLSPFAAWEIYSGGLVWNMRIAGVLSYCVIAGSVVAYICWNNALHRWPVSRVMLFNNLIPLTTMAAAHFCLQEKVTSTFWVAMILIVAGVVLGQADPRKWFAVPRRFSPETSKQD